MQHADLEPPHRRNIELLNELCDPEQWLTATKTQSIWAISVVESRRIRSLEGHQSVQEGQFLCRGLAGDVWPQSAESLQMRYLPTDEMDAAGWRRYRPRPDVNVKAIAVQHPFIVDTAYGTLRGKAGDFLVCSVTGDEPMDLWVVDQALFRQTYTIQSD